MISNMDLYFPLCKKKIYSKVVVRDVLRVTFLLVNALPIAAARLLMAGLAHC